MRGVWFALLALSLCVVAVVAADASLVVPYSGGSSGPAYDDVELITLGTTATISKMEVPTYDGSGQFVHPDVVRFDKFWHGWKYWMAFTPYPDSNSRFENPSIAVSNNGKFWMAPRGVTNPLAKSNSLTGSYLSDPDILYNAASDELWLYYRDTVQGGKDTIFLIRSSDGVS